MGSLKKFGLKMTKNRLAILNVFEEDCKPVSAEYVFKKLKNKVNIVTVYRTLESFEVIGILKRVDIHKEAVHYELVGHHHHHIVCTECDVVESFDGCNVDKLSKEVINKSSKFSTINQHSFELFGVCNTCLRKGIGKR